MIKENAMRALGAFSKCSDRVDFREDVFRAGWLLEIKKCLTLETPITLRIHAAGSLEVLLAPGVPEAVLSHIKDINTIVFLRELIDKSDVSQEVALLRKVVQLIQ
jgi:hypothetical protein